MNGLLFPPSAKRGSLLSSIFLASGMMLCAADDPKGLDVALKFRAGANAGNLKDDLHSNKLMGLGLGATYALGEGRFVLGELNYTYFGGGEYDAMRMSGPVYYNPAAPATVYSGSPVYLAVSGAIGSADARKNRLEGFGARVGYGQKFSQNWSWQAGLTLDRLQSRQELAGTLRPVYLNGATVTAVPPTSYYESLSATPTATKLGVGAFAGLKAGIGENFSFEFNLVSVGYTQVNYVPFTYSGQAPTTTTANRHGLAVELAFGLKL